MKNVKSKFTSHSILRDAYVLCNYLYSIRLNWLTVVSVVPENKVFLQFHL